MAARLVSFFTTGQKYKGAQSRESVKAIGEGSLIGYDVGQTPEDKRLLLNHHQRTKSFVRNGVAVLRQQNSGVNQQLPVFRVRYKSRHVMGIVGRIEAYSWSVESSPESHRNPHVGEVFDSAPVLHITS
jgi:hypothetical protein